MVNKGTYCCTSRFDQRSISGTSACSSSRALNDDVPASSHAPAYNGLASEARSTGPVHGVFGLPDVASLLARRSLLSFKRRGEVWSFKRRAKSGVWTTRRSLAITGVDGVGD